MSLGIPVGTPISMADDAPPSSKAKEETEEERTLREKRERYLAWMKDYAKGTEILLSAATDGTQPKAVAVEFPVFRYSDEEHRIPDATLCLASSGFGRCRGSG